VTANRAGADVVVLRWDDAILAVDPVMGGRLASLVVGGHELLVTEGDGPIYWGCYPMVPFAGRVRDGRFRFAGRRHQLPLTMPPNAIHGTVLDRPWHVMTRSDQHVELVTDLGPDWPFQGEVVQTVALVAGGLEASLELRAAEPMPVVLGWHPWFRRTIDGTAAALDFEARSQYLRGQDGLPTGATVPPTPRPWDDAFTDLVIPPRLTWPGIARLELRSDAPFWVVFDERPDAICVEPQTGPPDAFNLAAAIGVDPPVAAPDRPVSIAMAWRWQVIAPKPGATSDDGASSGPEAAPVRPSRRPRTRRARSRP
jgi:aldose 1-epimerase